MGLSGGDEARVKFPALSWSCRCPMSWLTASIRDPPWCLYAGRSFVSFLAFMSA